MKIYDFSSMAGNKISAYGSQNFSLTGILHEESNVRMACIRLGPEGIIGHHPAATDQLFLLIDGEGIVTGGEGVEYPLQPGFAVLWEKGEQHETRSDTGLTAFVVEGNISGLKMKEVEWNHS
ncbi:cupin domain-containing protein [Neobacillus mesonae]|nr:cupin domain-containing protein [Neobacillus mesonae]